MIVIRAVIFLRRRPETKKHNIFLHTCTVKCHADAAPQICSFCSRMVAADVCYSSCSQPQHTVASFAALVLWSPLISVSPREFAEATIKSTHLADSVSHWKMKDPRKAPMKMQIMM